MIHSSTITFGAKYLTGMVTNVPPYETTKISLKIQISEVCEL
jgi:hypothetical protein